MMPLAHSARKDKPAQFYAEHVLGVIRKATENVKGILPFTTSQHAASYVSIVDSAACWHDLGKLAALNQEVLTGQRAAAVLPVEHRDSGVKHLLGSRKEYAPATLVYAHHRPGLPNLNKEKCQRLPFRFLEALDDTEQSLPNYLDLHAQCTQALSVMSSLDSAARLSALEYRILLSSLVDADYSDTAGVDVATPATRWFERLQQLDDYVGALREGSIDRDSERNGLRSDLYACCRNWALDGTMEYCDSPVGTGKTTALMGRALMVAAQKGLRRIFVVLPFTNIISQTVDVLREALVLAGENPLEIVAEHHHQADFESVELRHLASTWTAPIIVTTAVQFFETLASNKPAKLRKLHQLPGSCVIIDESHAALPSNLMLPAWKWMTELTRIWGCHICFSSGTSFRFWESADFKKIGHTKVQRMLTEELAKELGVFERRRIALNVRSGNIPHFRGVSSLITYFGRFRGPRLIVLNTVRSAAYLTRILRDNGQNVLHLSTALSPGDREKVMAEIRYRLDPSSLYAEDWSLVATSLVECGLDFSFRHGFCELRSVQSYLQLGGRINRSGEYDESSLNVFTIIDDNFRYYASFEVAQNVFKKLVEKELFNSNDITGLVSLGFEMECRQQGGLPESICKADRLCDFADVAEKFKIISENTVTVVSDIEIARRLQLGQFVSKRELQRGSVNMRHSTLKELGLADKELPFLSEDQYDDFLGYMKNI